MIAPATIARRLLAGLVLTCGLGLIGFVAFAVGHEIMHPLEQRTDVRLLFVLVGLGALPWLVYFGAQLLGFAKGAVQLAQPFIPKVTFGSKPENRE